MADVDAMGEVSTVGQRLRRAREAAGLSLDDVAQRTRVPTRHLQAMEDGVWDRLPGPTYVAGFAKSYADVVGLPRAEIGDDIRAEMGGARNVTITPAYEPADPARVPPRTLAIGALVLLLLLGGAYWFLRQNALEEAQPQFTTPVERPAPTSVAAQLAQPQRPTGPVVITAREPVWVQVEQRDGEVLVSRELRAGERVEVPATATDPILRTGRAELLDVTVGGQPAPALGPPNTLVKDRSLKADALFPAPNGPAPASNGASPGLPAPAARP